MASLTILFGGTFDPFHCGHFAVAEALATQLRAPVTLLPNNTPPHRPQPEADAQHRLAMLQCAAAEWPFLRVDDRELRRATPSWTIDTLHEWRREHGSQASLAFVIGQDSLLSLTHWHRWQAILAACHLIVCARPGYPCEVPDALQSWYNRHRTTDPAALRQTPCGCIYPAPTPRRDISATAIRQRLHRGEACADLLPAPVLAYIRRHGLYASARPAT